MHDEFCIMASKGTGVYISPVYLYANKSEELISHSGASSSATEHDKFVEHAQSRRPNCVEVGPAGCQGASAGRMHPGQRPTPPPPPPPKSLQNGYLQCSRVACTGNGRTVPNGRLSLGAIQDTPGCAVAAARRSLDVLLPYGQQLQDSSFAGFPPFVSNSAGSSMDTACFVPAQRASFESSMNSTACLSSIDMGGRSSIDLAGRSSIDLAAANSMNTMMAMQGRSSSGAHQSPFVVMMCNGQQQAAMCGGAQPCNSGMLQDATLAGQPVAAFSNAQTYNQLQQPGIPCNSSTALPAIHSHNCDHHAAATQLQEQQRVVGYVNSPMPSEEYMLMEVPTGSSGMINPQLTAETMRSSSSTLHSVPPTGRPCSNSVTAGCRTGVVQQQRQQLGPATGAQGACLDCPLPVPLPQQQQQQYMSAEYAPWIPEQLQQQVSAGYTPATTVQEMLLKELQLQEMIASSNQITPVSSPTLQLQLQGSTFPGTVSINSTGRAGAIPAGIQYADPVISAPLVGLSGIETAASSGLCANGPAGGYLNCTNSGMSLQPMQAGLLLQNTAAVMCSEPLLPPAAARMPQQQQGLPRAGETAQMKMQQLVAVQQWQQSIEEELLQLLPMA